MSACRGTARAIEVGAGAEDFALQPNGPRGPRLLIAALRRPAGKEPGTLWSVDLMGATQEQPQQLVIPKDVFPAGMALAERDGRTWLYFTNLPPNAPPSIELFELNGEDLAWSESFTDARLTMPNDLAVTAGGDFYVTDMGLPRNALLRAIVALSPVRTGTVLHFDVATRNWTEFARKLAMPNGIAIDRSDRYVFVNEFAAKRLRIFNRATGEEALDSHVEFDGYPDNLQWETPQILDVALHVSKLRIGLHLKRRKTTSPSRGSRVDLREFLENGAAPSVELLYDFRDFNGGSSALVYQTSLYVSQVCENKVLVVDDCEPLH